MRVFHWRIFRQGQELLLPVQRKSYIRQLGMAAALGHLQLWAGQCVLLVLWWLLAGPRPFPLALLAGVLAFSAAFLLGAFGSVAWVARYRSGILAGSAATVLVMAAAPLTIWWSLSPPGQLRYEVLWIAGILAVLGLLITYDAYRRWLAADFD
jgi:hypothetical protein